MYRKIITLLTLISLLGMAGCASWKDPYQAPRDFKIIAVAGGINPTTSIEKVIINPDGEAVYYKMLPEDRLTDTFREIDRFKINRSALAYLYKRIRDNGFFKLNREYVDIDVLDGSFAELTVRANRKTHTVKTRNIKVKGFDTIMIAINLSLPDKYKVIYNEIYY